MAFRLELMPCRKFASKSSPVLASLFADLDSYDVYIIGTDSDSGVGAHKLVLSAASPVFKAMFTGQMKESTARDIPVAFSRSVIKCLVEFVYLDEVSVDPDTLVPLYAAADHYAIESLARVCKECLEQKVGIHNCFQWYIDSLQWGQLTEELATNCLAFIAGNFSEALSNADFALLPYETVVELLQRRDLVVNELCVFEGICRWIEGSAAAQTDQAKTLMESVCYPFISPADLVNKVGPSLHKSLPDYVRALEFHHRPSLNAVTAPQFLPRGNFPLLLPLTPLEALCNPKAWEVVLPPKSPSYCFRADEPMAVLIAKNDCRFSLYGQGTPCRSGHQHNYTLKLANLPTVGKLREECKLIDIPALSTGNRSFSSSSTYFFEISGKESSCVLSRAGTADCTIEHPFPIMVIFQVSCVCLKFTLSHSLTLTV